MKKCLIIGQGIAGTCLAFCLLNHGCAVKIVDAGLRESSSRVAAGVINPITGRRLVKTWLAEILIDHADQFYRAIAEELEQNFMHKTRIFFALSNKSLEKQWLLRTGDPEYEKYLGKETGSPSPALRHLRFGMVQGGMKVDLNALLKSARTWFEKRDLLRKESFNCETMHFDGGYPEFEGVRYDHVVFCEGYQMASNSYFRWLPLNAVKGEVLICRIPDLVVTDIVKAGVTIVPLEQNKYWVGSTYIWDDTDPDPTQEGRLTLMEKLDRALKCDFEIIEHLAGVRPSTHDRRPFVGTHPEQSRIAVLNGLGTKGASLAPWCAGILVDHLLYGKGIPEEADVRRFWKR